MLFAIIRLASIRTTPSEPRLVLKANFNIDAEGDIGAGALRQTPMTLYFESRSMTTPPGGTTTVYEP